MLDWFLSQIKMADRGARLRHSRCRFVMGGKKKRKRHFGALLCKMEMVLQKKKNATRDVE